MSAIESVPDIKSGTSFPVTAPMVIPKCWFFSVLVGATQCWSDRWRSVHRFFWWRWHCARRRCTI